MSFIPAPLAQRQTEDARRLTLYTAPIVDSVFEKYPISGKLREGKLYMSGFLINDTAELVKVTRDFVAKNRMEDGVFPREIYEEIFQYMFEPYLAAELRISVYFSDLDNAHIASVIIFHRTMRAITELTWMVEDYDKPNFTFRYSTPSSTGEISKSELEAFLGASNQTIKREFSCVAYEISKRMMEILRTRV